MSDDIDIINYWIEISECECASEQAIGSCFYCDMKRLKEILEKKLRK